MVSIQTLQGFQAHSLPGAESPSITPAEVTHCVRDLILLSLSTLARREDLQMPEAHVLLHIRKKKKRIYVSVVQSLPVVS